MQTCIVFFNELMLAHHEFHPSDEWIDTPCHELQINLHKCKVGMPFGTDLFSFRRNISSAKHISSNFNCISSLQGKHIENPKDLYPVLSTKQKRDEINRLFNAFIELNMKFSCLIQQHNRTVPLCYPCVICVHKETHKQNRFVSKQMGSELL